jgi:hypothetical protein
MNTRPFVAAAATFTLLVSSAASGQTAAAGTAAPEALTKLQTAVACAMSPGVIPVEHDTLRIVGSQDTTLRSLFGTRDLLVIDGGTSRHVQVGQRYFVRRAEWFGARSWDQPYTIRTGGWVRIVAANQATAIAQVDYACDGISTGDYLEPFAVPDVPADADQVVTTGTLDFDHLGHVLYGNRLRWTAGAGGFMLVDRGRDQGATVGARFAVYRDMRQSGVPLVPIGEVVVVSASASSAVVRVTQSRDAVTTGDYIVPRR